MNKKSRFLSTLFFFIITTHTKAFNEHYQTITECAINETSQVFSIIVKSESIHHVLEASSNEVVALILKYPYKNDDVYPFSLSTSKEILYLYREVRHKEELFREEVIISKTQSNGIFKKYSKYDNDPLEQYTLYCVPSEFYSLNWLNH